MKCIQCHNEFTTLKYSTASLCSRRCHTTFNKELNSVTKSCPVCSIAFTSDKRKNRVVCSRVCADKYQSSSSVVKEKAAKMSSTLQQRYGVYHNSQITGAMDKRRASNTLKYNDPNYTNRPQAAQTLVERYGSSSYNNRDKARSTMKAKYGVEVFSQSPLFKQALKQRYGANHPMQILKNKHKSYRKVVARLTDVDPLFDFDSYAGVNALDKYSFRCKVCSSEFESKLDDGHVPICRVCNPIDTGKSKCEFEIIEWIRSIYLGEIIHGDRTVLYGKELDIYLPELNLAIELNGLYWHGEICGSKNRQYHLNKTKRCSERGITLCHVLDIEWISKREVVKSILTNKIHSGLLNTIHGRKCVLREVSASDSNVFLNANHIQGEDKASVRIGLYYNNEMVSLLTFGKNRFNKDADWEMYRFCNKAHTNVRGSLEKMFSYFLSKYSPSSILTFSDRRYFDGSAYSRLNFKLSSITPPNYHYFKINNQSTIFSSRNKYQKHKLSKLLPIYDATLTEWQNMQINGYDRIWDCGNTKWIWIS